MNADKKSLTGVWQGQIRRKIKINIKDIQVSASTIAQMKGVELRQSGTRVTGTGHASQSIMIFSHSSSGQKFEPESRPTKSVKLIGTNVNGQVNLKVSSSKATQILSGTLSKDGNEISGNLQTGNAAILKALLQRTFNKLSLSHILKGAGATIGLGSMMLFSPGSVTMEGDWILTRTNDPSPNPGESVDQTEPVTIAVSKPATAKEDTFTL